MRRFIHLSLIILVLSACRNSTQEAQETAKSAGENTANAEKVLVLPYSADYNQQTQKLELKPNPDGDASRLSAGDMIEAINIKYPEIKLELIKVGHDTIHVRINDAAYLSETLGSAGSKAYLAESTYALTELASIKVVDFVFIEGDHAAPGAYTRKSF